MLVLTHHFSNFKVWSQAAEIACNCLIWI